MKTELFLAKKIVARSKENFSWTFIVIAITSIALGIAIMFVAIAILTGFKKEIREKVVGFSGHIQITRFSGNSTFEPQPIEKNQPFYQKIRQNKEISHIQAFANKAGIIKTKDEIQGVILKGVDADYSWTFFRDKMKQGRIPEIKGTQRCDEVIISQKTADLLNLKLNDDLRMYFIVDNNTLGRKFKIVGIYSTGLEEFDKLYVIGDIHHIQKLNNWTDNQVGGFEVMIRNYKDMERLGMDIYHQIGFSLDASTVRQLYPQIFDWLDLQDINVLIILILIILVSTTTIISTLLILILERTNMIGILKALGMRSKGIRKVFLYHAFYIVGWGMLLGNLLAFSLCWLQKYFRLVKLPEESYYVSVIPINLNIWNILLLNLGTVVLCYLIFIIPSFVISRITPVKAIRFS
ncbi:MAG: ABC transporter permease [Bacteroidales bacterium]|nr:ABC transporter permease [Bacteroidales bacterium]MDD4602781.1 ABC transporter permease [Bacteroidales bacterium]